MKTILFDLDGTLLPMKQDEFVRCYYGLLVRKMSRFGVDGNLLIRALNEGAYCMMTNDGSCTNEEAFWRRYEKIMGHSRNTYFNELNDFYLNEFNGAIVSTAPTPLAREIIDICHQKGINPILATNPLFPRQATLNRIKWAGLKENDFADITTYENWHYCKPDPHYYQEICQVHGLDSSDCLMVGNDRMEDLSASFIGMKTYLVTDTPEHEDNPNQPDYSGSLSQFRDFISSY